jgi:hypothetical protein
MGLPDEPSHIKGRAKFNRAASRAGPALDTDIELVIVDKSFRVDLHRNNCFKSQNPMTEKVLLNLRTSFLRKQESRFFAEFPASAGTSLDSRFRGSDRPGDFFITLLNSEI